MEGAGLGLLAVFSALAVYGVAGCEPMEPRWGVTHSTITHREAGDVESVYWAESATFASNRMVATLPLCTAHVEGAGLVDVENDYLPRVVACENGAADTEALKAQAVAARSYLYYIIDFYGAIDDGTSDQVYSCGRVPLQVHRDAVRQTAGQVLTYRGRVVAAFYVAGAVPSALAVACMPLPDDHDPWNTERYVTYNWGLSGTEVSQTPLGYIDPYNYRNRGCQSQNGADCLSREGWQYEDILRYYYGSDINLQVVGADDTCDAGGHSSGGDEPDGSHGEDGGSGGDGVECCIAGIGREMPGMMEVGESCFDMVCTDDAVIVGLGGSGDGDGDGSGNSHGEDEGSNGGSGGSETMILVQVAASPESHTGPPDPVADLVPCMATWNLTFKESGAYGIQVALSRPDVSYPLSMRVPYTVHHAGGKTEILVDQSVAQSAEGDDDWQGSVDDGGHEYQGSSQQRRWHSLGIFPFDKAEGYRVVLGDGVELIESGEAEALEGDAIGDTGLWAMVDAIRIVPIPLEAVPLPDQLPYVILDDPIGELGAEFNSEHGVWDGGLDGELEPFSNGKNGLNRGDGAWWGCSVVVGGSGSVPFSCWRLLLLVLILCAALGGRLLVMHMLTGMGRWSGKGRRLSHLLTRSDCR